MTAPEKTNRYAHLIQEAPKEKPPAPSSLSKENRYASLLENIPEPKEELPKNIARTTAQAPLGYLKRYTWAADLFKFLTDLQSQEALRELSENDPLLQGEGQQVAEAARQKALGYLPTQSGIEKLVEEKTGIPLTPKTDIQKAIRLGGEAAGFRPGTASQKATAGVVAPGVSSALKGAGVPEEIADIGGLAVSGAAPAPKVSPATKPSGLTTRQFESATKPKKISHARHEKITEAVETDFRKIADKILEKNKTYSALQQDPLFKEKIGNLFGEVENLAKDIKGEISTEAVRDAFKDRIRARETKGFAPSEYEKSFRKEYRQLLKDLPFKESSAKEMVEQFRKNNASLGEYFEPGKSSAKNRAKRDALLEYNRAIEDVFKQKYGDTEFKKLFEFTNKRWSEISDVEDVRSFMDETFKGKINYSKAKQLFNNDKQHVASPFKRLLGEEGFKDFKMLTEDLLSSEKAYTMLKKAEKEGFSSLAKSAATYVVSPKAGAIYSLSKIGKAAYQILLDKPKMILTWESGLSNLKKGKFKDAEADFDKLDEMRKSK